MLNTHMWLFIFNNIINSQKSEKKFTNLKNNKTKTNQIIKI